jgi:nucleotide-binding universal stress UspA family protein
MIRAVLLPLDGSPFAEQALPLALTVARQAGACLQVVQVHVPLVYVEKLQVLDNTWDTRLRERERAYLDAVVTRLAGSGGVPTTATLLTGPVAEALAGHAASTGADFILMTTHGRGGLSRFWLGSVTDEMVRRCPIPVVVIRPVEPAAPEEPGGFGRVLIPLDGSELAEEILTPAVTLGRLTQAAYTLLRVVIPPPLAGLNLTGYAAAGLDLPAVEQLTRNARSYLEGVAARLRDQGLRVSTGVAVHPQPAVAILEEARNGGADLIALETHGRRGLTRLMMGSVADKVVRGAARPVLVHRHRSA